MHGITVAIQFFPGFGFEHAIARLRKSPPVKKIIIVHPQMPEKKLPDCHYLISSEFHSGKTVHALLDKTKTMYLLLLDHTDEFIIHSQSLTRFLDICDSTKAGIVYSDFFDLKKDSLQIHRVNDYQPGSVRDDFDFGPVILFAMPAVRSAIKKYGHPALSGHAGWYDLRLKISIDHSFFHIQEPLYIKKDPVIKDSGERHFNYVSSRYKPLQKEMENVFTQHLKSIGAYLPPRRKKVRTTTNPFPVEASIIIPVLNRERTIADAVHSALAQETSFKFNIIIIDNHSTDATTRIIEKLKREYSSVKHIIPSRFDLGIGGCWNEAIFSSLCGRFAIQLDSDDLYSSPDTLRQIVDLFHAGNYAMVIGAYTLVDNSQRTIPPGLIDHREWTVDNGHNNALRINGLGAPRAFQTEVVRRIGFLNVSYGEDYAIALRISREWRIGRIFDSLYWCRRWEENTDANLALEKSNINDAFKDKLRTLEIMTRQTMNLKSDKK